MAGEAKSPRLTRPPATGALKRPSTWQVIFTNERQPSLWQVNFTDEEMAPLVRPALELPNVYFPEEWLRCLIG